jgi:chromosome segregation ATPase
MTNSASVEHETSSLVRSMKRSLDELKEEFRGMKDGISEINKNITTIQEEMVEREKRLAADTLRIERNLSDRVSRMENQATAAIALSHNSAPEPVRYASSGTGLTDPQWRWVREHTFRR